MSYLENRDKIVDRIEQELIGPGSDIFYCEQDFSKEIIEGKPLQRYFSAIIFPKQLSTDGSETGKETLSITNDEDDELTSTNKFEQPQEAIETDVAKPIEDSDDEPDIIPKTSTSAFFPSHCGLSFSLNKKSKDIELLVSFGNYKKAKPEEVILPYNGVDYELIKEFGFDEFVIFDDTTKTLRQSKEIKRKEKGQPTIDYLQLQTCFKAMSADHRNSIAFKYLTKLLFKDKYKRYSNNILVNINISEILSAENNHLEINLSKLPAVDVANWHKDNIDNLVLHLKLYDTHAGKYFIKAVIENKFAHKKDQFSISKEKLNQLAIFQTEIKVSSSFLQPFRDYRPNLYKTEEDKMLDYLFRDKLAFGIGHNASCTWENSELDSSQPTWIKTTFIPSFNVKSQSTETDKINSNLLRIKSLSTWGNDKNTTINNLHTIASAYLNWIGEESIKSDNNEFGETNIQKCKAIYERISSGINILAENDKAYTAFQLANEAIYIQMFQNEWHFTKRKDGFEVFERDNNLHLSYANYATEIYPNGKNEPSWRPFQLAFILLCIPSLVEDNSNDKELVDLLYFPTGGGKTEAYLAVSAFLIFWRRLSFPTQYDGVNIIIRYTLRLLSAQQFERATKLILACEFIRQNNSTLGKEKISIGFWIGNKTVPNSIDGEGGAKVKYNFLLKKLNDTKFDGKKAINPFQLTNCQWCNSKIISRLNQTDKIYSVGHRINKQLQSHCLNPKCLYNESNGGLPIVLIDDDIYHKPPTVLFGTVDKFATLAWKGEATTLFNYKGNRKPDLIIQDELHLLNGPLGSLVGLFENLILSLCSTDTQKPKIIASTATVKNVDAQIEGLYGKQARIFPQFATNSDDTFFSKTLEISKRRYIGILPTGKTNVMTNLQLLSSLLYARIEIWESAIDKKDADQYWTLLSYFKSLKEIGRFSNKISSELKPQIQQLQVRRIKTYGELPYNYYKLPYRNIELTSRIPNERIKKNLDKLDIEFDGKLKEHKAYDLVLATNMISVGLDVGRLGIMVMNGMPPNTAEYIQASSRVARKNEGLVVTLFDPFNSRDISYFEDFVQFHKTFYKQVEPLSVTPFVDSALDKMLFTLLIAYFRHKMSYSENNEANKLALPNAKSTLHDNFISIFRNHPVALQDIDNITTKCEQLIESWEFKIEAIDKLYYYWHKHATESLMKPIQEKKNEDDILVAMQSMRNVEANAEIFIKQQ